MTTPTRKALEERLDAPPHAGGPRTEEGRARCRANALIHGLTGAGVVLPDEMREAVERRAAEWGSTLKPFDAYECWLLGQMALQSVRVERCQEREGALLHEQAIRAEESWEADRRAEAGERAAGLARAPEAVAPRLTQSLAGCAWVVAQWEGLARSLAERGDWDGPRRGLALDLLGVPVAARGGPTPLDPPPGEDPAALRASVAGAELARLRPLRDGPLVDRDERARLDALAGFGDPECPLPARLRRYERQAVRQLEWFRSQFKNGRYTSPSGGGGVPPASYRSYLPVAPPGPPPPPRPDEPAAAPPPAPAPVVSPPPTDRPVVSPPACGSRGTRPSYLPTTPLPSHSSPANPAGPRDASPPRHPDARTSPPD